MANKGMAIEDGWYRLVKWREDGNPFFPSPDTVVEIRNSEIINVLTGRSCGVTYMGSHRSLYGPLNGPYDLTCLRYLRRIDLPATQLDRQDPTVPNSA